MTDYTQERNPITRLMAFAIGATLALGIVPAFAASTAYAEEGGAAGLVPAATNEVAGADEESAQFIAVEDMKPEATYTTEGVWKTDADDLFNVGKMFRKEVELTVNENGEYGITMFSNKVKYSNNTYVVNSIAIVKQNDELSTQADDEEAGSANVKEGDKFTISVKSLDKVKLSVKISQEGKTSTTAHEATLDLNLDTIYNENQVKTGFIDVSPDHWVVVEGWLKKAVEQELMGGYKNDKGVLTGKFGPDDGMTRGQFITILYRDAHEDDSATLEEGKYEKNLTDFTDNEDKKYYTAAINWAAEQEIVTGDKDESGAPLNTVRPNDPISRQEIATMLFRYNGDEDATTTQSYKDAPDADDVADWAAKGVAWCYDNQIMTGNKETHELSPYNQATRAETAKMAVVATDIVKENAEKKADEEGEEGEEEAPDEEDAKGESEGEGEDA